MIPEMSRRFAFMTGEAFTDAANRFITNLEEEETDKPFTPASLKIFVKQFLLEEVDAC